MSIAWASCLSASLRSSFGQSSDFPGREIHSDGQSHATGGEGVILNMAAQAETKVNMFPSLDRDMAAQPEERFRGAETLSRNQNLALQALASFESLFSDAIESFAAEILRDAFYRWPFLPQQTHRPMQWYPLAFAAISR